MIFSIYLTLFAAAVALASDGNIPVKIIAYIVLVAASAYSQYSYYKLKKEVEENNEFLIKTGKFLIETSSRVIDLMRVHNIEITELETAANNLADEQGGEE